MKIKAVIFDLDGVIVRTDAFHYLAWKKIADQENIYFDEKINHRLRGVSRMESLDIVLERAGRPYHDEEKQRLASEKNGYYLGMLSQLSESDVLDGVLDTLSGLRRRNIRLAVGSSSKNAGYILGQLGIRDLFDVVADGNDIKKSKPDPEVFLTAAQKLSVEPCYCAVVEDALSGIDAANRAGMVSFAIHGACGYSGALYSLKNIRDLIGYIGEEPL